MKIVFAIHDSRKDVGGVSSWLRRLMPRLQSEGIEVEAHVLTLDGGPGVNCAWFGRHGIPFRWTNWGADIRKATLTQLQFLEAAQPNVFVPNCILPAYFAAAAAKHQGITTVGVLHSDDPFYHGVVDEFIAGDRAQSLSSVVAVSSYLEDIARARARPNLPIWRIPCGVPLPTQTAGQPTEIFRLVYIGRLEEEQKRISEVTRALCTLLAECPNLEAWIVGEGSARPAVESIIRNSTLSAGRIRLIGRVDNDEISSILSNCHALVLLSDYEGMPVSVLEAMASGVVPICLDTRSGVREAIEPGFNGIIVRNRGIDFFQSTRTLAKDPVRWSSMSKEARATVERSYSIERTTAAWVEAIKVMQTSAALRLRFHAPRWFRLPPRNPKFGYLDSRVPWTRRRSILNARISFAAWRRKWLSFRSS